MERQTEVFDGLSESEVLENTPVSDGENVIAKYKKLYLQNEDMAGWISIDGTTINYILMQSLNEPNFYLKHNFEK